MTAGHGAGARERILTAAYHLISRRGVRAVGVNEVVRRSGVVKATLYRHFPSKDELVLAVLRLQEQLWTHGLIEAGALRRAATPEGRLLAVFDVLDETFRRDADDSATCSFVNVLLEMGRAHRLGRACVDHLAKVRELLTGWATEAGIADPIGFARSWDLLMKGALIGAAEGDTDAARRAKRVAARLLAAERENAR